MTAGRRSMKRFPIRAQNFIFSLRELIYVQPSMNCIVTAGPTYEPLDECAGV